MAGHLRNEIQRAFLRHDNVFGKGGQTTQFGKIRRVPDELRFLCIAERLLVSRQNAEPKECALKVLRCEARLPR